MKSEPRRHQFRPDLEALEECCVPDATSLASALSAAEMVRARVPSFVKLDPGFQYQAGHVVEIYSNITQPGPTRDNAVVAHNQLVMEIHQPSTRAW